MSMTTTRMQVLRDLARQVRDIAHDPAQDELTRLWRDRNALRKGRPLVLCSAPNEVWRELIPETREPGGDPLLDAVERDLERRIYAWQHFHDDLVITDRVYAPLAVEVSDWIKGRARPYTGDPDRAGAFEPCLNEWSDIEKLRMPEVRYDETESNRRFERIYEAVGDILQVERGRPYEAGAYHSTLGWGTSAIDVLCEMRGLERLYEDFYLNPQFVHDSMSILTDGILSGLSQLERLGVLRSNNNETILGPCGLGYSDELPAPETGSTSPTELWGFSQAQELAGVSPDTLEEFVLPYQARMAERFGLNVYGCCEANDQKWPAIARHIPRLRILSVSPWSDHETAAAFIGDRYVYCWKPHPSQMIATFSEDFIRTETTRAFSIVRDCCVVVCLRDFQTVNGAPDRLTRWVAITKEVAAEY